MTIFKSERLLIRKLAMSDFPAFHEMQSNLNVMQFTTGKAMTEADNHEDLKKVLDAYSQANNDFWIWAIERKIDSEMIGTVALVIDDHGDHEIGYRLLEKYWGQGYGREISDRLIDYALETLKVPTLVAYVDVRNKASVKILDESPLPFVKEYFNETEQCLDRYYKWIRQ